MNLSMYTAAAGAKAQQERINITANNMANLQTDGYKAQNAGFVDLLYQNYEQGVTDAPETGVGTRLEKTDFNFEQGSLLTTEGAFDFAIDGDGFFAVYHPADDTIYYTRNGQFHLSNYGQDVFYLVAGDGSPVLNKDMGMIPVPGGITSDEPLDIGIFDFAHKEGFLVTGNNHYLPSAKSGDPILKEDAALMRGRIEASNVELASEMARIIESQRAYQMTLKMIQVSDEVDQTINSLR